MKRSHSAFRRLRFDDALKKRAKMSQPGIENFTRRVTRRGGAARLKSSTLDTDNSNIVSLAPEKTLISSPRKTKKPEIHESSPAKISKVTRKIIEEVGLILRETSNIVHIIRKLYALSSNHSIKISFI